MHTSTRKIFIISYEPGAGLDVGDVMMNKTDIGLSLKELIF
jgi:hypothetical protein